MLTLQARTILMITSNYTVNCILQLSAPLISLLINLLKRNLGQHKGFVLFISTFGKLQSRFYGDKITCLRQPFILLIMSNTYEYLKVQRPFMMERIWIFTRTDPDL